VLGILARVADRHRHLTENEEEEDGFDDEVEDILENEATTASTTRSLPPRTAPIIPSAQRSTEGNISTFSWIVYSIPRPEIYAHDLVIFKPEEVHCTITKTDRRLLQIVFEFIFDPHSILSIAASIEQREDWVRHYLPPRTCVMKFPIPFEIGKISPAVHAHANFLIIRITPSTNTEAEIKL
jgi:hypothetical protein